MAKSEIFWFEFGMPYAAFCKCTHGRRNEVTYISEEVLSYKSLIFDMLFDGAVGTYGELLQAPPLQL